MSFTSFLSDRQAPGGQSGQPQTANQLFGSTTFQSQPTGATEFVADNHGGAPSPNTGGLPTESTTPQLATASDLFNTSAYDPAKLHPLANLGDNLDYLLTDEAKLSALPGAQSALPSRGWSDELSYGVGSTYLSGACNYTWNDLLRILRENSLFYTSLSDRSCVWWTLGSAGGYAS